MSLFLSPLRIQFLNGWDNGGRGAWLLLEPFHYHSDLLGREIVCPQGMYFDGASVPRLPVAFALYGGRYWRAACVHDWLVRDRKVSRETADKVFLEAMRLENAEEVAATGANPDDLEGRALTMYGAVSVFTKSGLWKEDVDRPGFDAIG